MGWGAWKGKGCGVNLQFHNLFYIPWEGRGGGGTKVFFFYFDDILFYFGKSGFA